MKHKLNQFSAILLLFGMLPFGAFATPSDQNTTADQTGNKISPEEYLEFESVLDGKCQNLSSRGKLRIVKNNHPDKTIKYRFNRMFAGKRQAGLTAGRIEPGDKPVKLGCTLVDGREQTWKIKIVSFVE